MAKKMVVERALVGSETKPRNEEVLHVSVDSAPIGVHVIFHRQLTPQLTGAPQAGATFANAKGVTDKVRPCGAHS